MQNFGLAGSNKVLPTSEEEMKDYEGMFIIRPDLSQEETDKAASGIEGVILKFDGKIKDSSTWGKRQFTYEIGGHREGSYRLIRFEIDPGRIGKVEKDYGLNENILKYLNLF